MSIGKFNNLVKKNKGSVVFLYLLLISQLFFPTINSSRLEGASQYSLQLLNIFIEDDVYLVNGKSQKYSLIKLNGQESKNEKETKLIIEKNAFYTKSILNNYLKLDLVLSYLEKPNVIYFIPRSPPEILS